MDLVAHDTVYYQHGQHSSYIGINNTYRLPLSIRLNELTGCYRETKKHLAYLTLEADAWRHSRCVASCASRCADTSQSSPGFGLYLLLKPSFPPQSAQDAKRRGQRHCILHSWDIRRAEQGRYSELENVINDRGTTHDSTQPRTNRPPSHPPTQPPTKTSTHPQIDPPPTLYNIQHYVQQSTFTNFVRSNTMHTSTCTSMGH